MTRSRSSQLTSWIGVARHHGLVARQRTQIKGQALAATIALLQQILSWHSKTILFNNSSVRPQKHLTLLSVLPPFIGTSHSK